MPEHERSSSYGENSLEFNNKFEYTVTAVKDHDSMLEVMGSLMAMHKDWMRNQTNITEEAL